VIDDDFDFAPAPRKVNLRDYQIACLQAVQEGWAKASRQLIVMATGLGKTVCFSRIAQEEVEKGGRVLILAHTDELLEQAIDKLRRSTGLIADKEKADQFASPSAKIVVASIQTISRQTRLIGFKDNHFTLVIVDEAHRSLAASYQRVMRYFHFGAESLVEGWDLPAPDIPNKCYAKILGVTATADRGDKRSLGEFFQLVCFDHGLLQAVRDGYLVRPLVKNVPLKIDLKGIKKTGGDYDAGQIAERITPFLKTIAACIKAEASDRKTVVFTPSVETAKLLAEAVTEAGLNGSFVSGDCHDRTEKIEAFDKGKPGCVIACAMLLIEGWDCDSASCVCILRPTKIRSLYVQAVGRCTRTLTGLIDGIDDPKLRLEAIKNSLKPNMLILDFLWLTDRLDLIKPIDLVATRPEIREKMDVDNPDLCEAEALAERDLLASLAKAAKKHSRKNSRLIDPIAFAVNVGDSALQNYTPVDQADTFSPDLNQLQILERNGIDITQITCRGHAAKIIDRISSRIKLGLCTPKQMNFLIKMGFTEDSAALTSFQDAHSIIGRRAAQGWR
jgi:hypothetical protein